MTARRQGGRDPALPRARRLEDRHRQAHGRVQDRALQLHEHQRAQAEPLACITARMVSVPYARPLSCISARIWSVPSAARRRGRRGRRRRRAVRKLILACSSCPESRPSRRRPPRWSVVARTVAAAVGAPAAQVREALAAALAAEHGRESRLRAPAGGGRGRGDRARRCSPGRDVLAPAPTMIPAWASCAVAFSRVRTSAGAARGARDDGYCGPTDMSSTASLKFWINPRARSSSTWNIAFLPSSPAR